MDGGGSAVSSCLFVVGCTCHVCRGVRPSGKGGEKGSRVCGKSLKLFRQDDVTSCVRLTLAGLFACIDSGCVCAYIAFLVSVLRAVVVD